jgi:uncharacterized caspase-like protein
MRNKSENPNALVVVSFSTHGGEDNQKKVYLQPEDADPMETETLISVAVVLERLLAFSAKKQLVLIDACRVTADFDKSPTAGGFSNDFYDSLSRARGQFIFTSSSSGEPSKEFEVLQHGLFTAVLLEALGGAADSESSPLTTLGFIADHVTEHVKKRSVDL